MHRCALWRSSFLAMFAVLGVAAIGRCDEFPYTAVINSVDVFVRSGPGKNYYPTGKLAKGEKVEVYRHDPGGWCAIRPPKSSFSWVAARQLDPMADDLAVVNGDRVVARVGSTLSNVRDVIQVRLDKGEKVEVLASAKSTGGHWYKIAPPSGEFRWVFAKFLDHDESTDGTSLELVSHEEPGDAEETASTGDAESSKSDIRLTAGTSPLAPATGGAASSTAAAEPVERPRPVPVRTYGSPGSFQRELNDLDLAITAMMVKDPRDWSWEDLHARAQGDLNAAKTAPERGRARSLLNKVTRMEDIKQRHGKIAIVPADSLRGRGPVDRQTINTVPQMGGYDGIGRLQPVVSRKKGAPQYALLDEKGGVACFISPAPGVNLQSYINKQIGVTGRRSYVAELQKQQVDVQRVTLLDTTRR